MQRYLRRKGYLCAAFTDMKENNILSVVANERWLGNDEVKEMLCISTRTLQTWRSCGILPYSKVRGKLFYRMSDIQALLNQSYNGTHIKIEED